MVEATARDERISGFVRIGEKELSLDPPMRVEV